MNLSLTQAIGGVKYKLRGNKTMSREPNASEISKAIGKKPVYKLASVSKIEGFLSIVAGSSLAGSSAKAATKMRYKVGQITTALTGTKGLSVYEDKDRAIRVAPQFAYGRKVVVLKCLPVGDKSAGFTQNSVCVPALIVGSVVHIHEPEWKDVTLELVYRAVRHSLAGGTGQFLVVSHNRKDIGLIGVTGIVSITSNYKVENTRNGSTVPEFRVWKKSC